MRWINLGRLAVLWLAMLTGGGQLAAQYSLNGRVQDGSTGVEGVLIATTNFDSGFVLTTETVANGDFAFLNLPAGRYSVGASKTGTEFNPERYDVYIPTNTTTLIFQVVYRIGGQILEGTNALAEARVNLTPLGATNILQSTNSGAFGRYVFSNTVAGFYVVTPSLTNYIFAPTNRIVEVGPAVGTNRLDVDFQAFGPIAISGRVTVAGAAFPNVQVTASPRPSGGAVLTNRTDASGGYSFPVLIAGTYDVTPSASGFAFTPATRTIASSTTNADFSAVTASLTGRVTEGGAPVPDVLVQAGTNSATTDADGYYAFSQLSGPQVLVPSQAGQTFNPARVALSLAPGLASVDFERGLTVVETLIRTCDEPSLDAALGAGGVVEFGCDGAFALTGRRLVTTDTVLDGAGLAVTISGGQLSGLFQVEPEAELILKGLVLRSGGEAGGAGTNGASGGSAAGGAIFVNGGQLGASDCRFMSNGVTGGMGSIGIVELAGDGGDGGSGGAARGGALFNLGGVVRLTNCVFAFNTASAGAGGKGADGAQLGGSNDGGDGGDGGIASGGAIHNTGGGRVLLIDCTFSNNVVTGAAGGTSGAGNGLLGFPGANGGPGFSGGGAVFSDGGELVLLSSTLNANRATGANGGDGRVGALSADGAAGTAGGGSAGGGVHLAGGSLAMTNCTLFGNRVAGGNGGTGGAGGTVGFGGDGGDGGKGGDALGGALWMGSPLPAALANVTFASNSISGGLGGAGGAAGGSTAQPGSPGSAGVSAGGAFAAANASPTAANCILAYSSGGQNVSGPFLDAGSNISSDGSPGFVAPTSRSATDPLLAGLADNDGPTLTSALLAGSPAIDAADDTVSLPVDQRGLARNGQSDIGAFESAGRPSGAVLWIREAPGAVVIGWPAAAGEYTLEGTPTLGPADWTTNPVPPVRVSFDYVVTNSTAGAARFYRLR